MFKKFKLLLNFIRLFRNLIFDLKFGKFLGGSIKTQYKFLGSTLDPVFGRTDASIYTNLSISNRLFHQDENGVICSIE